MSNPSNLYAEKIFSEHPLVLWALDDQADYISLITEEQRDIESQWDTSGGTAEASLGFAGQPFGNSTTTVLEGTVPVGATNDIICISPNILNFQNLNSTLGTFSVGAYFYSNSVWIESVSVGYEYTDTTTSTIVQKFNTFNTELFQSWGFVSGTFEIPDENTDFRVVIKITTTTGGLSGGDYQFYLNGITVGQWAEEFHTNSLGVEPTTVPSTISIDTSEGIAASAYGSSTDTGYYLAYNNSLIAKNTSVPLVFGASGVTKIIPNANNEPSLILPGKGFLNKVGQHKEYTVEFWARINSDAYAPKRIFGPIASTDGLYVEGGFLTLVIGKRFSSHFVGEWFRPMLIHIRVIRNSATVLLNGEEIISLIIDTDTLELPTKYDINDKDQDWLGFYAYTDVNPIEVDCVAIYSYQVPVTVAKRRWVYGQGVLSPEGINSAYGGTSAFIDYPFADYTANYNYPDFAQWDQGTFDNLTTTTTTLTTPQYSLPEIFLSDETLETLYTDNLDIQDPEDSNFITFRPNVSWNNVQCYFNFPRFNILNNQISSIYGVFSASDITVTQTLFKIYNTLTGNYFLVQQDEDLITYKLYFGGATETLYSYSSIIEDEKFAAGINLSTLTSNFGENVAAFFGNQNGLKIYVGGDEVAANTFKGKIYSFGMSTSVNALEISSHFTTSGFAIEEDAVELLAHTASYTLLPSQAYETFFLDIGVSGYWEDYLPLSYFAQFVKNDIGNEFYDLDFLQFNLGYPSPSRLTEKETTSSWTYGTLRDVYSNPTQRTYSQLDNNLFTGWNNYEDMAQRAAKYYEYDTSDASVKSYITLQYITEGANAPQDSFTTIEPAKQGSIIDIDLYPDWQTTKFEVVNNTLIYPTKTVDFNELALVYHLEFNVRGILSKPISLRRLELASQALSDNSFNPIGTRFGVDLFPYKRSGIYYDYKSKNPFSIYKGSTPYLYLTRNSGIEVRGDFDPLVNRGIAVPMNQSQAADYSVSAMQMWMRYDEDTFPSNPVELFEIDYKEDTIKFYIVADSEKGTRAKIFAKSLLTGLEFNGLTYYLNGTLVREPVLTVKEWSVLGLAFAESLNLDYYLGGINLNGPMIFNNVAYYQANNLQQVQRTLTRPWLRVKTDGVTNFQWNYWRNNFVWEGVLVISASDAYGVNPSDIYKTYLGTNKIIIDDDGGMNIDLDRLRIYNTVSWQTTTNAAV
jgi:hypothetical protein